jgi:hypothetical protein
MNIVVLIGRPTREYESASGYTRFRVLVESDDAPPVTVNVQPPAEFYDLFRDAQRDRMLIAIDGHLAQVDDGHATVFAERAHLMRPIIEETYTG